MLPSDDPTGIFCRDCHLVTRTPESWNGLAICPKCEGHNVQMEWPFHELPKPAPMISWRRWLGILALVATMVAMGVGFWAAVVAVIRWIIWGGE